MDCKGEMDYWARRMRTGYTKRFTRFRGERGKIALLLQAARGEKGRVYET